MMVPMSTCQIYGYRLLPEAWETCRFSRWILGFPLSSNENVTSFQTAAANLQSDRAGVGIVSNCRCRI